MEETTLTILPEERDELEAAYYAFMAMTELSTTNQSDKVMEWYTNAYARYQKVWNKILLKYAPDLDRDISSWSCDFMSHTLTITEGVI